MIKNAHVLPKEPKKMLYAIFFNSSGPVVQVPCPSGHSHWPILQEFCTEESERVLQ